MEGSGVCIGVFVAKGVADGEGLTVGFCVGLAVGEGLAVGLCVGLAVGEGLAVGFCVGLAVGEGLAVGFCVGPAVGEGLAVGFCDGPAVGEGLAVGEPVPTGGWEAGTAVGVGVGVSTGAGVSGAGVSAAATLIRMLASSLLPDLAVIVAVPSFWPVTMPLSDTWATELSEDVYVSGPGTHNLSLLEPFTKFALNPSSVVSPVTIVLLPSKI